MNNADPTGAVLDAWIAYELFEADRERQGQAGAKVYTDMNELKQIVNHKGRRARK